MDAGKTSLDTDVVYAFLRDAEEQRKEKRKIDEHVRGLLSELMLFPHITETEVIEGVWAEEPEGAFSRVTDNLFKTIKDHTLGVDDETTERLEQAFELADSLLDIAKLMQEYLTSDEHQEVAWKVQCLKLDIFEGFDSDITLRDILLQLINEHIPVIDLDIYDKTVREQIVQVRAKERALHARVNSIKTALSKEIKGLPVAQEYLDRADFNAFVTLLSEALANGQPIPQRQLRALGANAGIGRKDCQRIINSARVQLKKVV